jgi:hypothetical protein
VTLPRFITFTGVDDETRVADLHILAARYPVEFGVLFSPKQQGSGGRYPSLATVQHLLQNKGRLQLAAHICGGHSRDLIDNGRVPPELGKTIRRFNRVQVNTARPRLPIKSLQAWGIGNGVEVVLQCREQFPAVIPEVSWLFDASGGRGLEPEAWPKPAHAAHARNVLKGYAGGLNADNVAAHVRAIGEHDELYWIDMESGVRDAHDRFSVAACRRVCEAVYG